MHQVLLDIIIRQVQDMEPDDTRRCLYLDLLRVTILHSQWADRGYYRKDHVIAALESIFAESGEHPGVWSVVCAPHCLRCLCRVPRSVDTSALPLWHRIPFHSWMCFFAHYKNPSSNSVTTLGTPSCLVANK